MSHSDAPWAPLAPTRGMTRRTTNVYDHLDLYQACEERRFEEMRIPLGTDRVMNDLLRLQHALRESDGETDESVSDLTADIGELKSDLENLQRELEDA